MVPGGVFYACTPVPERNKRNSLIRGTLYSEGQIEGICQQIEFCFESIPAENGALLYFKAIKP